MATAQSQYKRSRRKRDAVRFARKRRQVEAFGSVLRQLMDEGKLGRGATVVDFGSSSGNLLLPLAATFPELNFVGVDLKRHSVALLRQRVTISGLSNVRAWHGAIQDYDQSGLPLDMAMGLHVCGEASDLIIMLAVASGAPWALSPCCIGGVNRLAESLSQTPEIRMEEGEPYAVDKSRPGPATIVVRGERVPFSRAYAILPDGMVGPNLVFSPKSTPSGPDPVPLHTTAREAECKDFPVLQFLLHGEGRAEFEARKDLVLLSTGAESLERPRSKWLSSQLGAKLYAELASLADAGAEGHARFDDVFYHAKTVLTLDRGMWAVERGHEVSLRRIVGLEGYAKDDLLIGSPL